MTSLRRIPLLALALVLLLPCAALAAEVVGTFPSDLLTKPNAAHLTGLQVDLPKGNCVTHPNDCADVDVLNDLDGFNIQPRISIEFSEAIDPTSVNSASVHLISLGSTTDGSGAGKTVGINQVVWDPATNTLHVESDELLDQHTRYLLVVTRGVRDTHGNPLAKTTFTKDLNFGQTKDATLKAYRKALLDALEANGLEPDSLAAASIFTTQSATAILEKIRNQLKAATPAAANFVLGLGGERTVFPLSTITGLTFNRQTTVAGALSPVAMPLAALFVPAPPSSIGTVAFGKFSSPNYLNSQQYIPAVGTRTGTPATNGANDIYFNLFVPAGTKPAGGWPVAIFGHGFGDNKNNSPLVVAATLASQGIATIAINVVGHGFGAAGTITVNRLAGGPVTLPAGGRGIDQNGNGTIDSTEGSSATVGLISSRDGLRQTVADLMQLVRVIQVGVDVDGVGGADLDANRIYYFGQSFGGIYGVKFIAVEPAIRAGVANVPGGAIIEIVRLSPVFRALAGLAFAARVPTLCNAGPVAPPLWCFQESIPLRDDPAVTAPAPGAMEIQQLLDNTEWASQSGNPVAYAPHLRKSPLDGVPARPFIIQSAKGDQTVPNPTASAIVRAADAHDRWTLFRNDLVRAARPGTPANPHTFLTNIGVAAVADLALAAQMQIAVFFASDGTTVIDPDGSAANRFFEVPIFLDQIPLMDDLNF